MRVPGRCRISDRWFAGDDADARLQAAFLGIRILPPPAAGAAVGARLHGTRAGCTADAGVALVMQRVVRQLARADVIPDVVVGPVEDGADLGDAAIGRVHFHRLRQRARDRLFMPHAGDPCAGTGDGTAEGLDLADVAAALAVLDAVEETVDAVPRHPGFDGLRLGVVDLDAPLVAPLQAFDEVVRFLGKP